MQRILPSNLSLTARGHSQPGAVASSQQLRRHQEDLVAQSRKRCTLKLCGQTQPFEPVDQIVRQQQEMKVSLVGQEMMRRNLAQVITAFEFANDPFHARPAVVEAPQVQWLQREIGNKHLIKILAQLAESQLLAGPFCLGSSHHYKAVTFVQSQWLPAALVRPNPPPPTAATPPPAPLL